MHGGSVRLVPVHSGSVQQLSGRYIQPETGMHTEHDCVSLATLAYPWTSATWQIVALRVLQGSAFGIALMATGSTLAIDVAPSHQRDGANRALHGRASRACWRVL